MSDHVRADIPSYLNGDLSETRRQKVEEHLGKCASCRQGVSKLQAKAARGKRQAPKNAPPERVPNLLVSRLVRQAGAAQRPHSTPWGWIFLLLALIAAGALVARRRMTGAYFFSGASTAARPLGADAVGGFDIAHSSPSSLTEEGEAGPEANAAVTNASGTPAWGGAQSAITDARQVVVRNHAAWRGLWREMGQTDPVPTVDFEQQAVVGIFAGERPAGAYQIAFGAPREGESAVTIPYKISVSSAEAETPATLHPYALATVPQTPKRIRFSEE